jgi:hypothetical protein
MNWFNLFCLFIGLGGVGFALAVLLWTRREPDLDTPPFEPESLQPLPVVAPVVEPVAVPRVVAPPMVRVSLVTARGLPLGSVEIPKSHRRPTLQRRIKNGQLASFVCAGQKPNGDMEYRMVGVDRE